MNLDILDPGLHSLAGHHLEWNLRLIRELAHSGHQMRVFAHRQIDDTTTALLEKHAKVVPHFQVSPYLIPKLFDQHTDIGMRVFDPLAGQLVHFLDGAKRLAENLEAITPGDLSIWPSLAANQLCALAMASSRKTNLACVHVDPSFSAPAGAMFWRYAWMMTREAGVSIRLGVTVPELQGEYSSVLPEERIHMWPICVDSRTPMAPHQAIRRIGFFGHQRGEKGVDLLQQLVPQLLSKAWQVVVHDSGHLLRGEGTDNLIKLGYVEDIASEIEKCDLIVTPYDPAAYRSRGSGVVWEAIACGVPVIVPSHSAPGRFALSLGAGIGLSGLTANDVSRAVLAAESNYKTISENAFMASRQWSANYGARHFANALMAAAKVSSG